MVLFPYDVTIFEFSICCASSTWEHCPNIWEDYTPKVWVYCAPSLGTLDPQSKGIYPQFGHTIPNVWVYCTQSLGTAKFGYTIPKVWVRSCFGCPDRLKAKLARRISKLESESLPVPGELRKKATRGLYSGMVRRDLKGHCRILNFTY